MILIFIYDNIKKRIVGEIMSKKILGNVEPKCEYCKFGKNSPDGIHVLCHKKGIYEKDSFCKKFRYDPLKHIPQKQAVLQQFSAEDFEL